MNDDPPPSNPKPKGEKPDRMAAALRANLARRKAQKKSRSADTAGARKQG
jgi:hypothetical protein